MSDIVVTVPVDRWAGWIAEGDLPGQEAQYESHFWLSSPPIDLEVGDRLYIVAHGKLRGYAPITDWESHCGLNPSRACVIREGDAVAVTIPESIRGFRGWRSRWWDRADEVSFPDWKQPRSLRNRDGATASRAKRGWRACRASTAPAVS